MPMELVPLDRSGQSGYEEGALQDILAIEREAQGMIRDAEAEAQRIVARGREEAEQLRAQAQAEAEQRAQQALDEAAAELDREVAAIRRQADGEAELWVAHASERVPSAVALALEAITLGALR